MRWMFLPLWRYADFRGRACRREFWAFVPLQIILIGLLVGTWSGASAPSAAPASNLGIALQFFSWFGVLIIAIPSLAVMVRRFHDSNRPGWSLIVLGVPVVGILILLHHLCADGTPGDNGYGPNPRDWAQPTVPANWLSERMPAFMREDALYWMALPLRRCTDFRGRSRRLEYWAFVVGFAILMSFMSGAAALIGDGRAGFALPLVPLALLVPLLAVQVRRYHDIGKSGWHVLLNLVPLFGSIAVFSDMCKEGMTGDNRFGHDPKDPGDIGDVFA